MPSAQDCAERLREQAYRTLLPQIRDLQQELQNINNSLSSGVQQMGRKLEALSHVELPTTEVVLTELLGDVTREKDLQASALILFARSLRQKDTQEEILTLLLDAAQRYSSRTALFAVRGNNFVGWSSRGFAEDLAGKISSCSFPRVDCPRFESILEEGNPVAGVEYQDIDPIQFMEQEAEGTVSLFPLNVMQRPVALLLAVGGDQGQSTADALSILAEFTVLRLENIALKILYELTSGKAPAAAPVHEVPVSEPVSAPEPEPTAEPVPDVQAFSAPEQESIPEPFTPESNVASEPEPAPRQWAAAQAAPVQPVREPEPAFDLDAFQKPEPAAESLFGVQQKQPSAPIEMQTPAEAPAPPSEPLPPKTKPQEVRPMPEEEKLHSEAKRFARLLVSEIKLYNEHHVVEGRANRDLYLRLKRDIDRSREMYEKRVSPNVSRRIDYFHDEIIRILGDNDLSTLGSDYPGPRVES